ncbi:secreted RxLR effector protein 161-like [Cryptomeria japonica]|uniref:secreted RxLR effector protein 161-like n=1 Tax=Cryptomeria japonica TaxID=3369 RepID=UPI0025AD7328|nr:secreted RxLR effector protein 161-like [Cryptomeria japonica]
MEDCKPISTPMEVGKKLSLEMCPRIQEEESYMSTVSYQNDIGSLMYAMVSSRPDIAHAVRMVSQFSNCYGPQHWAVVKRIFRYLQGTINHRITFSGSSKDSLQLTGYCDADWLGDIDSKRSTLGFCFILSGGIVSWASKKQPTVSLSSG